MPQLLLKQSYYTGSFVYFQQNFYPKGQVLWAEFYAQYITDYIYDVQECTEKTENAAEEQKKGQKKIHGEKPWIYANPARSDCTGHIAGAETPCTDVYMARSTVDNRLDALHIGLPGTIGTPVRVGDLDTECHALAADIAFCHQLHLLAAWKSV